MKILYFVHQFFPEYYTGTEKFVYNVATMNSKAGHNVKIVSYSYFDTSDYSDNVFNVAFKDVTYDGLQVTKIRKTRNEGEYFSLDSSKDFHKFACNFLYKEKPDLVHFGHTMRVHGFVNAANFLGIPFVATLTDFFLLCPKVNLTTSQGGLCQGPQQGMSCARLCPELAADFVQKRLTVARDTILNKARKLYAPSQFVADIFRNELPDLEIKVIGHGILHDHKLYEKKEAKDKLTIIYAGSFNRFKGLHVLLDAFEKMPSKQLVLKVYGSGTDQAYSDEVMNIISRDGRIEYCGVYSSEQVGKILSQADLVVIPSLCYETYSLVMHECFQKNIPVAASNLGALADKIVDGENGFLFNPGDSASLSQILGNIAAEPEKLNVLKNNIKKIMVPTIEQEALAYERDYVRLVMT